MPDPGPAARDVSRETRAAEALFGGRAALALRFADRLRGEGIRRGLIGPREAERVWDRHVVNCAVVAPAFPVGATVADVGSGAGLPGIVLAIARPDLRLHLVEPLLRRVTFLEEAVTELGLDNVEVVRSRAEDMPADSRYDVVTARAVAPVERLAGWCLPLVRAGGLLLAMKGERAVAELEQAVPVLRALGAASWSVEVYGQGVTDPPARLVTVRTPATLDHGRGTPARRSSRRRS